MIKRYFSLLVLAAVSLTSQAVWADCIPFHGIFQGTPPIPSPHSGAPRTFAAINSTCAMAFVQDIKFGPVHECREGEEITSGHDYSGNFTLKTFTTFENLSVKIDMHVTLFVSEIGGAIKSTEHNTIVYRLLPDGRLLKIYNSQRDDYIAPETREILNPVKPN
jgi:hypothetical protein